MLYKAHVPGASWKLAGDGWGDLPEERRSPCQHYTGSGIIMLTTSGDTLVFVRRKLYCENDIFHRVFVQRLGCCTDVADVMIPLPMENNNITRIFLFLLLSPPPASWL